MLVEHVEPEELGAWTMWHLKAGSFKAPGLLASETPSGADNTPRGDVPADARVLPVRYRGSLSSRHRDWRGIADVVEQVEFEVWPLQCPRTALWVVHSLRRRGRCPATTTVGGSRHTASVKEIGASQSTAAVAGPWSYPGLTTNLTRRRGPCATDAGH